MAPYFPDSKVVGTEYDSYFKQWVGDYTTTLIYRWSERKEYENEFSKKSYQRNNIEDVWGPTIFLIKSKVGEVFGGFTSLPLKKMRQHICILLIAIIILCRSIGICRSICICVFSKE